MLNLVKVVYRKLRDLSPQAFNPGDSHSKVSGPADKKVDEGSAYIIFSVLRNAMKEKLPRIVTISH